MIIFLRWPKKGQELATCISRYYFKEKISFSSISFTLVKESNKITQKCQIKANSPLTLYISSKEIYNSKSNLSSLGIINNYHNHIKIRYHIVHVCKYQDSYNMWATQYNALEEYQEYSQKIANDKVHGFL